MKKMFLTVILFVTIFLGIASTASATITVYPNFNFIYKDRASGFSYTIYWRVENSDQIYSPSSGAWYIGTNITYPLGSMNTYNPSSGFSVTEPTNPPVPNYPYRIEVIVIRSDNEVRSGYSDWTNKGGMEGQGGTLLEIDVALF